MQFHPTNLIRDKKSARFTAKFSGLVVRPTTPALAADKAEQLPPPPPPEKAESATACVADMG